jgi:carbamoyltransferase
MIILGIGGILGDAASAILKDGELVAAVEESKLARQQSQWGGQREMPEHSIATCLELAGATPDQVDAVAVVRPIPQTDFHLKLRAQFPASRIVMLGHHLAHAASAYYPSPFEDATVLTLDQWGDLRCGARWQAQGTRLSLDQEQYFPDSLGDLYGRVAELLGFEANADEHKVQWL